MEADIYVLDDIDKEEVNITIVDQNYGSQLLEFIIDSGSIEDPGFIDDGAWFDVKPEVQRTVSAQKPGEKSAGISAGGGSPCLKPGSTTPVNANETATPTTGGGGASDVPKQDESAAIGAAQVPILDATGQGSSGTYNKVKFTGLKNGSGWWISPIKKKMVTIPTIKSKWLVTIETWAVFTNVLFDIHNEVEDLNLFTTGDGQNEGSFLVREIKNPDIPKTGWPSPKWSNHSSGTGVDINTHLHPFKTIKDPTKRGFSPQQLAKIDQICGVRYKGGMYPAYKYNDDMHFEVKIKPAELAKITKDLNLEVRAAAIQAGTLKAKVYPPSVSGQKSW